MTPRSIKKGKVIYGLAFIFFTGFLAPVVIKPSQALEYRSVAIAKAVMLDAPSANANKLYIVSLGFPVEVIVNLGDWLKVRDNQGGLNWLEARVLSTKHTILVTSNHAEIKQSADVDSALLAIVDKDVVLDLLEANTKNGWLKVHHRDGITGYILITSVWGAN